MEGSIVLCREYSTTWEAALAAGFLRDNGVEVIEDNALFASIYPIGFNSIGAVRLMVREQDLEKALTLLDQMHFDS